MCVHRVFSTFMHGVTARDDKSGHRRFFYMARKKKRKRKKQSSSLFKIYLNDNYKVEIEIHYNYDNNKIFCNFMVCYFIIERDEII